MKKKQTPSLSASRLPGEWWGGDGEDDFTVKDVIDFTPEPTSKSVRYAFTSSGFAVRRFTKMPGHHCYELQVRRTSAPPFADDKQARKRVAEILSCAGLHPGKDELMVGHTGDRLQIGFGGVLEDVKKSAGFIEL